MSEANLSGIATTSREHRLIERIKELTGDRAIGDDCAVLPGQRLVTSDALVDGVHFLMKSIAMADLGWKAIAVNLSDIAAMAGRPRQLVVNLVLPPDLSDRATEELYAGMVACARAYRTRIVGGDLTGGQALVISVTVLGDVHERGCLLRSGAQVGDVVVATGDFGASRAGLFALTAERGDFPICLQRHVRPLPRLCESWALVRQVGSRGALMDASDGLADACLQIARASSVRIELDAELIPVADETRRAAKAAGADALDWALYGGEDYELVGCLAAADWTLLAGMPACPFRQIGRVVAGSGAAVQLAGKLQDLTFTRTFQHWN